MLKGTANDERDGGKRSQAEKLMLMQAKEKSIGVCLPIEIGFD